MDNDLKKYFSSRQNLKALTYILTKEQDEKLINAISVENAVNSHKTVTKMNSDVLDSHSSELDSGASILDFINIDGTDLKTLGEFLKKDLAKSSQYNVNILIDFESSSTQRRLLEESSSSEEEKSSTEETEERFKEKEEPIRQLATGTATLRATPDFISGFCFGLMALVILLVGVCSLYGVKTPEKFARFPLIVGRES